MLESWEVFPASSPSKGIPALVTDVRDNLNAGRLEVAGSPSPATIKPPPSTFSPNSSERALHACVLANGIKCLSD